MQPRPGRATRYRTCRQLLSSLIDADWLHEIRLALNQERVSGSFDALYFTVAALTTTGFGDITLIGTGGHILAVLIMIFGITLFLRLVQTSFRPGKVRHECPTCGRFRHDADAVHCKHCGTVLHIATEGSK